MRIRTLLKPLSFLPAILLMFMIYHFSGQEADVSTDLSYKVSYRAVSTVNYLFDTGLDEYQIENYSWRINGITRKLAHMTEYFLLAIAMSFPLYVYGLRGILLVIVAGGICVAFACADEYHQSFVSGRAASWKDVGIDSFGILVGIILVRIIGWTGRHTLFMPSPNDRYEKMSRKELRRYRKRQMLPRSQARSRKRENADYADPGFDNHGHGSPGYGSRGYDGPGYDNRGYDGPGYDSRGYDGPGYDNRGYDGPGYDSRAYGSPGYDPRAYNGPGYDRRDHSGPGQSGEEYGRPAYGGQQYSGQQSGRPGYDGQAFDGQQYSGKDYGDSGWVGQEYDRQGYGSTGFGSPGGYGPGPGPGNGDDRYRDGRPYEDPARRGREEEASSDELSDDIPFSKLFRPRQDPRS